MPRRPSRVRAAVIRGSGSAATGCASSFDNGQNARKGAEAARALFAETFPRHARLHDL